MSMEMIAQVRTLRKLSSTERCLLMTIASHASPSTGYAWPSIPTLAAEIERQPRQTINLLKRLEARGLLSIEHARGRGRVNRYRVSTSPKNVQCSGEKHAISPPENVQFSSPAVEDSAMNTKASTPERSYAEREKKDARARRCSWDSCGQPACPHGQACAYHACCRVCAEA